MRALRILRYRAYLNWCGRGRPVHDDWTDWFHAEQLRQQRIREAAYFHWLDRGRPIRDEWADWFWAEALEDDQDQLLPDQFLGADQSRSSLNGCFTLVYQGDGNLVLYQNTDGRQLWASNTKHKPTDFCIMQRDGNLVIYGPAGEYIWGTATNGNPGSRLIVQDDGNVVIYNPSNQHVWATNTGTPTISNFMPTNGQIGDRVTVNGDSIIRAKKLLFGNSEATFSVFSFETIIAIVPKNANSGPITVITPVGSATSSDSFTVVPTPRPAIDNFEPPGGLRGSGVFINGRNLLSVTTVQFNGVDASFRALSDGTIIATVPDHATDGPIRVSNRAYDATSSDRFNVYDVYGT